MAAHSWLPNSLQHLIGIPILLAKQPEMVDFQNLVPIASLGVLVSAEESPGLYRVATSLDLFSFWALALLALAIVMTPWILHVWVFKALLGETPGTSNVEVSVRGLMDANATGLDDPQALFGGVLADLSTRSETRRRSKGRVEFFGGRITTIPELW